MMTKQNYPEVDFRENLHILDHPLARHKLALMRDGDCSTSKFRQIAIEMGILLACEASKKFDITIKRRRLRKYEYEYEEISGKKTVVVPIIRSGLPMAEGALLIMPSARIGHMGFRKTEDSDVEEHLYFLPQPEDRDFIIMDTEICTGKTACLAIKILKDIGVDGSNISFCTILIAPEGLERMKNAHPEVDIYAVSLENGLDEQGDTVPGFNDNANNKMFGTW